MPTDTLINMVRDLRAEAGHSLATSQGVNQVDTLKYILKRTQYELYTAFSWTFLKFRVGVPMAIGQETYPFPSTMPFEQIRETWFANTGDSSWYKVTYGLSEAMLNEAGEASQSGSPVQFYEADAGTVGFRVWPKPSQPGTLRFVGMKPLAPLVADADNSTLDSTCIILFAAAELLARAKAEDAAGKLQKAQRHLMKLLGQQGGRKTKVTTLGAFSSRPAPTAGLDYIP